MIHIFYHVFLIQGVDKIVKEQINLIQQFIKEPYSLNIGISIQTENSLDIQVLKNTLNIYNINYKIINTEIGGDEMVTLSVLEKDKSNFDDKDLILYIHTKGASRQNDNTLPHHHTWRQLMNYFNIENYKLAIDILNSDKFNTYGVLLDEYQNHIIYSGNFWWTTGKYIKTINTRIYEKTDRNFPQFYFLQSGIDWKPYSPYNRKKENHYHIKFDRSEYKFGEIKII
jgi:hypothetical protein